MFLEFLTRIGTFFILVGIGILILFVASDGVGRANFDYLFWALLSIIVGLLLRRRREPPPPSERFGVLKRFRREERDHRDKR
jgi:hypothetical protein